MHEFRWLDDGDLPPAIDLRMRGWTLLNPGEGGNEAIAVVDFAQHDRASWLSFMGRHRHASRALVLLVGVNDANERARMLRAGFGDVIGDPIALAELEARALRLIALESMLPRFRQVASLRLDLLSREGFVGEQALGLLPREFNLLWRLSDRPGSPFGKRRLMEDVWHMRFVPETNSLAVHVSRLRAKLRKFGCDGLLQTTGSGDYLLAAGSRAVASESQAQVPANDVQLDSPAR